MKRLMVGLLSLAFVTSSYAQTTLKMGLQASVGSVEYVSSKIIF